MYVVANYDWNWKCETVFETFSDAFMKAEITNEPGDVIEHWNFEDNTSTLVWSREWEKIILNKDVECGQLQ